MTTEPAAIADLEVVDRLVRVSMLVRLVALVVAVGGLVGSQLTPGIFVAILLMSGTSFAALSQRSVLDLLMAHPLLAMGDLLVVMGVFTGLGVDSPLSLGALSTALLVGLLYQTRVCILLAVVLEVSYFGASLSQHQAGDGLGFFLLIGMPVTLLCLVGVGQSTRKIAADRAEAERRLNTVLRDAAAAGERSRLAREVHDTLAKALQGMAFTASTLPLWMDRDPQRARAEAASMARDAGEAVDQARSLLTQMRLDTLDQSFEQVVTKLTEQWAAATGHPAQASVQPVAGLSAQVRYELLACLREALENVGRHAPDAPVAVTLALRADQVVLEIADEGMGFDPSVLASRESQGHFGVRGITERMATVGGVGEVASRPGVGVIVRLSVPSPDSVPGARPARRPVPALPRNLGGGAGRAVRAGWRRRERVT